LTYGEDLKLLVESHKNITHKIDELLSELAHLDRRLKELNEEPDK